ncbi:uncharacterized protein LOC132716325 [Ruditapes philippinarum]|uniref:uncharacterized protein LOC132716325 n=1 Tax=Ruditapes philippinarum TaxID=129788 RepID=UPI00295B7566|nr:uncharacterized protein LOC132716325 [Ruditapes philippinarum]
MDIIVDCPPLVTGVFDDDVLKRTLKLQNVSAYGSVTMNDAVECLQMLEIPPNAVELFSRGQGDKEVSIVFNSPSFLNQVNTVEPLVVRQKRILLLKGNSQIVNVRVHWLPVFIPNPTVEAIFRPFGKVLTVEYDRMKVGSGTFKSGVRLVKMEVTEIERNKLPHLLRFECGNKALITVAGRPPLCLKCLQIGHYRSNCANTPKVQSDIYSKIEKSISDRNQQEQRRKTEEELKLIEEERRKDVEETKKKKESMDDKNDDGDDVVDDDDDDDTVMEESIDESRGTKRTQDQEVCVFSFMRLWDQIFFLLTFPF